MTDNVLLVLGGLILVACLVFVVIVGVIHGDTYQRCVRAGYPEISVTWTLDRYCVARVNQSDRVVPLEQAEAERRP